MCIGLPMRVTEVGLGFAWCEGLGARRRVNTLLVDEPPIGTWMLIFQDTAREIITAEQALLIGDALKAVNLAMAGETNLDRLFPDLAGREPTLPDFLQTSFEAQREET